MLRIRWSDPTRRYFARQVGRACGPDIVQLGDDSDGRTTRWRFVERAPEACRWLGEDLSSDDGEWRLEADFRAQRVTPGSVGSIDARPAFSGGCPSA